MGKEVNAPALDVFWGKADVRLSPCWHPLVYHMLDVAAVAGEVLRREPAKTRALHAGDFGFQQFEEAEPWILFFVALHDMGKATPSFQKLTESALPELNHKLEASGLKWAADTKYVPHGDLGHLLFRKEIVGKWLPDGPLFQHISQAINSHHGFAIEPAPFGAYLHEAGLRANQDPWRLARASLMDGLRNLFVKTHTAPERQALSGAGFMRLAGLTAFSDWIGSNTAYFPYFDSRCDSGSLDEYWETAIRKAVRGLDQVGWFKRRSLFEAAPVFESCFAFSPRPLQTSVAEVVAQCSAPALIIVEAPMGEGKTEAGLYAHAVLQQRLGHRGMYVALPTQATGNAMFRRTRDFLEARGAHTRIDLQLLHGASLLNTDFQDLKLAAIYERGENQRDEDAATVAAHEWFTNKKRALLSEYGVGTIDQALLSVLNVKHRFVRLWGLGNRTVIVDEVHAYDVFTSTILDRLLEWLKALGSSVILMSATLPAARRRELLSIWGAEPGENVAYPRVTVAGKADSVRALHFPADARRKKTIRIKPAPVPAAELANFGQALVQEGGCLAIIVNTVQRAQELFAELRAKAQGIELHIFHARFTAEMRKEREDQMLAMFGKAEAAPRPKKAILVGTQVLEQSLDLDFDVMISDLAPIDLLLQRVGRVHRHDRPDAVRYNHTEPSLYISGMGGHDLPELGKPLYWSSVYDAYVLYRTWIGLNAMQNVRLPEDIDHAIENVYGERAIDGPWGESELLVRARDDLRQTREEDEAHARHTLLGSPAGEQWSNSSGVEKDDEENPNVHPKLLAKTRKGDRSITAIVLFRVGARLYLDESANNEVLLDEPPSLEQTMELYKNSINLSRWDVYNALKLVDVPLGWRKNALLRNCRALEFADRKVQAGSTIIHYSKEVGISYEKRVN